MIPVGILAASQRQSGGGGDDGPLPTVIGEPYGGGFFAGEIAYGGKHYKLIVAPKSAEAARQWLTASVDAPGTDSEQDGMANTLALASHSLHSEAADYCLSLTAGGKDDWYLPARDELGVCYANLRPSTTDADEFKTGSAQAYDNTYYQTSTQSATATAGRWTRQMSNGYESASSKTSSNTLLRPVRRIEFLP